MLRDIKKSTAVQLTDKQQLSREGSGHSRRNTELFADPLIEEEIKETMNIVLIDKNKE